MSERDEGKLSRRDVVAGGLAGAAALGLASLVEGEEDTMDTHPTTPHHDEGAARMPVVFIPHGGGPYSYVEFGAPAVDLVDIEVPMIAPADAAVAPVLFGAPEEPAWDAAAARRAELEAAEAQRIGNALEVGVDGARQKAKQYVKLAAGLD